MKSLYLALFGILFFQGLFFPKALSLSLIGGIYTPLASLSTGAPILTRDIGLQYFPNKQWSFSFEQRVYGHLLWSRANRHSLLAERELFKRFQGIAGLSLSGNGTINFQLSVDIGVKYKLGLTKTKWIDFEWLNYIFPDSVISELESTFVFNDVFHLKNFAFLVEIQTHTGIYHFTDFAPGIGIRLGGCYQWKGL